jgi:hypothetical protein
MEIQNPKSKIKMRSSTNGHEWARINPLHSCQFVSIRGLAFFFLFSGFGFLLAGCTHAPVGAAAPHGATVPIQWVTLSLDDAKPLIKMRAGGEQVDLLFKLRPPQIERTLYFGEITNGDEQVLPVVVTRGGGQYKALPVERSYAFDHWRLVVSGPGEGEIWAALDQDEADRAAEVALLHSTDAGKTWQVGLLRKPCPDCAFADLAMSREGRGRITLALEVDCKDDPKLKSGYYHFRTQDGGKTWAGPVFEPDATQPSEEVPEEEQPGKGQVASLQQRQGDKGIRGQGELGVARWR